MLDSDGSTIIDGYVEDATWDHDEMRRLHMTNRGSQVPTFSVASESREEAPQPCTNFDRAASDVPLEHTNVSILSWSPGPRRGTSREIENHNGNFRMDVPQKDSK